MSSLDEVLSVQRKLEDARAQWRVDECDLLRERAILIRTALDEGCPIQDVMSALGVNRQRVYAMIKQGRSGQEDI